MYVFEVKDYNTINYSNLRVILNMLKSKMATKKILFVLILLVVIIFRYN